MVDLIWRFRLSFSFFIGCTLLSCEKQDEYFPALTHEGRNTIGYFKSENEMFGGAFNSDDKIEWLTASVLLISYRNVNHIHMWQTEKVDQLDLYFERPVGSVNFTFVNAFYTDYNNRASLDIEKTNALSLTYHDIDRKIVSGIFELNFIELDTIYDNDTTSQIDRIDTLYMNQLYKGRFDIKYPD